MEPRKEEASTMSHSHYLTLIDRGRKAGLGTRELYTAMSTRPSEGVDEPPGQVDGNGFVPTYNNEGKRVYRPADGKRS
jgi:hypothetical protein